jgi:predicted TIM-barrel fold metal-dependent hydrolase
MGGNYTTLVRGEAAVDFLKRQPLGPHDMEKVAHLNAERVLRL